MKRLAFVAVALAVLAALGAAPAAAVAVVGQPAPAFALTDSHGKAHSLADFKGKVVVLEWWNHECPFVGKHYGSGNMQKLQKEWTAKGVVWLTVSSSAPGKQGTRTGRGALMKERPARDGGPARPRREGGKAYGANEPAHFVIDAKARWCTPVASTTSPRRTRRPSPPRRLRVGGARRGDGGPGGHDGDQPALRLQRQVRGLASASTPASRSQGGSAGVHSIR
jgi:peroxiredoxin